MKIAVFCVGNRLMLDDGIGPAVYDELVEHYEIPEEVDLYDLGCMTMKLLSKVDEYDYIITVDAVDGTDSEPGTVFRYKPEDIARTQDAMASLHELKLVDLFDAAQCLVIHVKASATACRSRTCRQQSWWKGSPRRCMSDCRSWWRPWWPSSIAKAIRLRAKMRKLPAC